MRNPGLTSQLLCGSEGMIEGGKFLPQGREAVALVWRGHGASSRIGEKSGRDRQIVGSGTSISSGTPMGIGNVLA
jgi:hypothetical protein